MGLARKTHSRHGLVDRRVGLLLIEGRLRTDNRGGKDHVLVVKIGVQAGNGRIRLELLPQTHDDHQRRNSSNRCEAEPHELLPDGSTRFGDVSDTVERRVLEELLRLIDETPAEDDQSLEGALLPGGRLRLLLLLLMGLMMVASLLRHFRFRNIARPHGGDHTKKMKTKHNRSQGPATQH